MRVIFFILLMALSCLVQAKDLTPFSDRAYQKAVASNELYILFFSAEWCQFCPKKEEQLKQIMSVNAVKDTVVMKYEYEKSIPIPKEFDVTVVPTILVLRGKKTIAKYSARIDTQEVLRTVLKNK